MKKDVVSFVFSIAALSVSSSCFGMATERFFAAYNAHRTELLDAMSSGPGKSFVRIMDAEQAKYKASNEALALRVLNFFSKDRNHSGFLFGTTLYVFMMAYDLNILADGEIPADKSGAIGLFAIACDAGKGVNADGEYAPLDDLGDSNLSDTYHVFADSYRLPEDEDKTNRTKADLLDSLAVGGFTRAQAFHQLLLLTEMVEMGKVNGTVIGGDAGPMPYDKATYDKVFVLVKKIIGE